MEKRLNQKKTNAVRYTKKKLEHWQVVSIALAGYDAIAIILSFFLALWFRFDCRYSLIPKEYLGAYFKFIGIYAVFSLFVFLRLRLYNSIWRFASYSELMRMILATAITFVFHCVGITFLFRRMPMSYYFFGIMVQFGLTLAVRFAYRFVLLERSKRKKEEEIAKAKKVLLIGGGKAGQIILRDIKTAQELKDIVCCIIDDNPNKWGRYIEGVPIVGGRDDIMSCVERYHIDKIIVALPSATAEEKRDILNICKETGCELKNLPGVYQFLTGEVKVSALRDVAVEELLGRDPIKVNMEEIHEFINGKKVMVTGGGGSIGSGLCRQIASYNPKQLIIFDIYENNAYDIQQELRKKYPNLNLVVLVGSIRDSRRINSVFETYKPDVVYHAAAHKHVPLELRKKYPNLNLVVLVGSIRDSRRINSVFETYKPDVVYHAAAHKHVPLMEDSPCESIKNNAIGTYKTAYAAMMNGCQRFVLISTDKAVNPTNIMGASKRLCEMIIQSFDRIYKTAYAAMMNGCQRFVLISTDKAVNPTNIMGASKRLCEMIIQSFDRMIKDGTPEKLPILYAHADDEDGAMVKQKFSADIKTEFVAVRFGNVLGSNGSVIPLFKKQIAAGGPVTVTHPDIIRYFMTIPEAVSLVLQAGTYAHGGEIFMAVRSLYLIWEAR